MSEGRILFEVNSDNQLIIQESYHQPPLTPSPQHYSLMFLIGEEIQEWRVNNFRATSIVDATLKIASVNATSLFCSEFLATLKEWKEVYINSKSSWNDLLIFILIYIYIDSSISLSSWPDCQHHFHFSEAFVFVGFWTFLSSLYIYIYLKFYFKIVIWI